MPKELAKVYKPSEFEKDVYQMWLDRKYFHAEPDSKKKPFTIVIPPPNVTGQLHMGHALDETLQDILIRYKRMQGYNALWVPGTDHAGIATQIKVEQVLREEEGLTRYDLGREKFLERVWDWKKHYGDRIVNQLKKLGSSCDWDRERFTMDQGCSKAVKEVFVNLYNKGLIYRGNRIINWCPKCVTALSDAEVIYSEEAGFFWHIRYPVKGSDNEYVEIATTRPETMLGDTAVAVNPNDKRYSHLVGKTLILPLVGREIPVVADDYVDMEFGTGCVKITPCHDPNDFEVGKRHGLEEILVLDDNAKVNANGGKYEGLDRYEARRQIVDDLKAGGYLVKVADHVHNVGKCYRCGTTVEPIASKQWFVKMQPLAKRAIDAVKNGETEFVPDRFKKTYLNWMENVRDWCISRQLWWGQRIPAYYLPDGRFVVEPTLDEAFEAARKIMPEIRREDLRQDEDVLDTWFSSWLWPISVFDPEKPGFPDREPNRELAYYYPTNDLITAPEILFFWVARMIMAGEEFTGRIPFSNVYLTGIVRDKFGRKMSKQLGNSPDPIELMKEYGADGVRVGMLLCTTAGNDIMFDKSQVEQGRNFANKIWNAYRLIQGWEVGPESRQNEYQKCAVDWFESRLNKCIEEMDANFAKFRLSDSLMALYKLFWDDFCAWYLELAKPSFGEKIDSITYGATVKFFDALLKLLHPYMPFITEELWQNLEARKEGETIMFSEMPSCKGYDPELLEDFEHAQQIVMNVRNIRQSKGIASKERLSLYCKENYRSKMNAAVLKLANIDEISARKSFDDCSMGADFMVSTYEFFIPLNTHVNAGEEIEKINKEIEYLEKFLKGVNAKLSNEKFVANAPESVVAMERKKQSDAQTKIENLKNRLCKLIKD